MRKQYHFVPFSLLSQLYSVCILSLTQRYAFITKQILWLLIGASKDYQLLRLECSKRGSRRKFGIVWWDNTIKQGMWLQDSDRVHAPKGESRGKLSSHFIGTPLERILTPFCRCVARWLATGTPGPQWSPFWEFWIYFPLISSPLPSSLWERSPGVSKSGKAFIRLTCKKKKKMEEWGASSQWWKQGSTGGALSCRHQ